MTIYKSPYPDVEFRDLTITQRVFQGVAPDAPLLTCGNTGNTLTGAQFMDRVKRLAGALAARGFGPGDCAAILAPNSPEYAVVFHGALWAGGTVTTINPTYTAEEVRFQLTDSGADILFTPPAFAETARLSAEGTQLREIVVIGEPLDEATSFQELLTTPPMAHQTSVDLDTHVACLPYSSGTTGLPKGVMLTHRNLVVNVDQSLAMGRVLAGETAIAFLPFFHIYGMQVLMNACVTAGARVVTMPRFDLEQFLTLIEAHRCKSLWIVPPVALALAKHPIVDRFDLSSIEQISSAAAPLGQELSTEMGDRLGTDAVQGYGMTELSPTCNVTPLGGGKPGASGVLIPNTQARVVDPESLTDVATGADGEIWIRGPQVMKGYLNNPDATAGTITPEGWLRTGDIGHFDEDGYLFITDRLKELIKVKGFQVAPAELEGLLLTHPDIQDAAVIGLPDPNAGEIPMAFVVSQKPLTLDALQIHLDPHIAHYKQIKRFEQVAEIPKSASGKILRRVLKDRSLSAE